MNFEFLSKEKSGATYKIEFSVDGIKYIARTFPARCNSYVQFSEWATDQYICSVFNLSPVSETAIRTAFEIDDLLQEDYHRRKGDLLEFSLKKMKAELVYGLAGTDKDIDDLKGSDSDD